MIPRTCRTAFLLLLNLLLATIAVSHAAATDDVTPTPASTFHCPESCTCTVLEVAHREKNYARCTSVDALHDKQWPVYSLDLIGLELQKVPATVEKLRNLTRVNLSHNHIAEVARLGNRVQEVDLSHNRIGSGKMAKLPPFIRKLNLAHNHITVVPVALQKLEHLRELELAGNPINCSCETIQVRNWLQSRHVWTEEAIKCALPHRYKGRPWLQVKQSDVCHMTPAELEEEEKNIWEENTNDLMMGDQPAAGSGEGAEAHHEDEHKDDALEDDYMPVDEDDPRAKPHGEADADAEEDAEEGSGHSGKDVMLASIGMGPVEGSGTGHEIHRDHVVEGTTTHPDGDAEDEDEGSGGVPIVPIVLPGLGRSSGRPTHENDKDFHEEEEEDGHGGHGEDEDDAPIDEPVYDDHTPKSLDGLGIFEKDDNTIVKQEAPVQEASPTDSVAPKVILGGSSEGGSLGQIEPTEKADSKNLYIMLAIILIVMIGLIVLVVVKQRNARRRNNRRGQADVEQAKLTELQDMNKRLVGKPLDKNGNGNGEKAPLMGDRDRSDFAKPINGQRDSDKIGFNPYEKPQTPEGEKQVPLKGHQPAKEEEQQQQQQPPPAMDSFKPNGGRAESKDSINEIPNNNNNDDNNNNNNNDNQFQPIANGYPQENGGVPHSPPEEKRKRDEEWEKYTPRSPDMKRYSPVYSPETGRVKIRLTETPKPKTPLLVTRSRSNAGQMILTPNLNQRPQRPENETATEA